MFDDEPVARTAHRRPQRQIPQEPGDAKGAEFVAKALIKVIAFDDFNADNDPHGEHDFGSFEVEGELLEDRLLRSRGQFGSEEKTLRVLTVMLAEKY